MYINNAKLTLRRHLIKNLIWTKTKVFKVDKILSWKKTKCPNILTVLLVPCILFYAFSYLWNLIVKKKNKNFKTGLISLYILLIVAKILKLHLYTFFTVQSIYMKEGPSWTQSVVLFSIFLILIMTSQLKFFCMVKKILRAYLRCYFQDLLTSISVVAAMLPIMERPNAILNSEFANI